MTVHVYFKYSVWENLTHLFFYLVSEQLLTNARVILVKTEVCAWIVSIPSPVSVGAASPEKPASDVCKQQQRLQKFFVS